MARESDVLRLVQERFGVALPSVRIGPGDDAAVLDDGTVITTDTVVEGVHVDARWCSWQDVGWKAVHAAVSDVPAMGARPANAVMAATLPSGMEPGDVAALLDGIAAGAEAAATTIVGGDVTTGPVVVLTVTVTGRLVGDRACTRAGAGVGDVVAVVGRLGWAAAGLAMHQLAVSGSATARGVLGEHPEISEAHRRPRALVAMADVLADPAVTSGLDVSDGLGRDLGHVATASGVRIELGDLRPDAAVVIAADVVGVDPVELVLGGGDDHALAITVDPGAVDEIRRRVTDLGEPFTVVGTVRAGSGVVHEGRDVTGLGWEHA